MTEAPVPFLSLAAGVAELRGELDAAYRSVVDSGWFVLGQHVDQFEAEFAAFTGTEHCVSVGNGLDALVLALRALKLQAGAKIAIPAHTFIATYLAVRQAGAQAVLVDVDPVTMLMDLAQLAGVLPHVQAVIPVHLYGSALGIGALREMAGKAGVPVIEDAAQAHGAMVDGHPAARGALLSCWSFYPGKNLGALGDAGAITTNSPELARELALLRNYGSERKYEHVTAGTNSRLDELQAAFLSVKLKHLVEWNARRAAQAAWYDEKLPRQLIKPTPDDRNQRSSWHLYVVRTPERDALQEHLRREGIETLIHYPRAIMDQGAFLADNAPTAREAFPVAFAVADTALSLPIGPQLTRGQQERVVAACHAYFA